MFVGHLAVGLGAKRYAPSVGLGWLVAGVVALDLVWPVLVLAGVEHVRVDPGATAFTPLVFESYPWSHSLVMALAWGVVLAALVRWRGFPGPTALLVGALVPSHWLLDFFTHAPDLPLWPGASPVFGLGLWESVSGTFVIEGALWVAGILLYLRVRPLGGWRSHLAFWSFVLASTAVWALGPWSPLPPSGVAVAWFGLVGWLTVPWAILADRRVSADS